MTAKEKAKELVEKYTNVEVLGYKEDLDKLVAVECAKIAVEEIINSPSVCEWENEDDIDFGDYFDFWEEVKKELENY